MGGQFRICSGHIGKGALTERAATPWVLAPGLGIMAESCGQPRQGVVGFTERPDPQGVEFLFHGLIECREKQGAFVPEVMVEGAFGDLGLGGHTV